MSTRPERQDGDGDGSIAANGACSTLEQTLLGVAPAPKSGTAANPTPPVPPVADAAAAEPARDDAAAPAPHGVAAPASRGFEPVPVPRGHLADSVSGALGPLADFGGSRRSAPPPLRPDLPFPRAPEAAGRWPLLIAVALSTVAVVWLGGHLLQRYRTANARQHALAEAAASRALLANRPAPEPGEGRARVLAATGSDGRESLGSGASPESQLAATAARHVLSGNYAEALPIYRQLERNYSGNTSYAALARLLEKKVGSRNDTRTVTPAPGGP